MRAPKQFFVYVMTNGPKPAVLYVGVTGDLRRRVWQHKNKLIPGFTTRYNLSRLVYYERFVYPDAAISRETEAAKRGRLEGVMVRLENAFEAFMVPATAGFLSALIIFGIAMVYFVAPSSLQAGNDVPLVMVNTAPQLQQSAFGMTLDTIDADSLVIEAYVDANGRVQDYRILSDTQESKEVLPQVKRMLIFTTFRPALSMGRPTPSRAVLSFSKISVKG